jgi:hypothetical protein
MAPKGRLGAGDLFGKLIPTVQVIPGSSSRSGMTPSPLDNSYRSPKGLRGRPLETLAA